MKKAVMIIAHDGFRDEEFQVPKTTLVNNGIKVTVASSSLSEAAGTLGAKVKPDILLGDIDVKDYDAVIFVGGGGAQEYWDNPNAHIIANRAVELNKIVAAICIAPVTLAKAGILKGKKATVWPSEGSRLKQAGAFYTGKNVEVDGRIITADGPKSAGVFADTIVNALK